MLSIKNRSGAAPALFHKRTIHRSKGNNNMMAAEVSSSSFLWSSNVEGFVWVGTYLKQKSTHKVGIVSAVCGPTDDRRFAVTLLVPFSDAQPFGDVARARIESPHLRDIPELVVSSETDEFASHDVNHAFVIHFGQLQELVMTYIQGMENVYLVRYDNNGEYVLPSNFHSFHSQQLAFHGVCIASSVW